MIQCTSQLVAHHSAGTQRLVIPVLLGLDTEVGNAVLPAGREKNRAPGVRRGITYDDEMIRSRKSAGKVLQSSIKFVALNNDDIRLPCCWDLG